VYVIVPLAPAVPPERVEPMDAAAIDVPAFPPAGADAVVVVAFLTVVEAIPEPHVLADEVLFESPP
jgi:molybdopterin biosynthesis enzyme